MESYYSFIVFNYIMPTICLVAGVGLLYSIFQLIVVRTEQIRFLRDEAHEKMMILYNLRKKS